MFTFLLRPLYVFLTTYQIKYFIILCHNVASFYNFIQDYIGTLPIGNSMFTIYNPLFALGHTSHQSVGTQIFSAKDIQGALSHFLKIIYLDTRDT